MMKFLLIFLFILSYLSANEKILNYDVQFNSLLGGSGKAKLKITKTDEVYSIILEAKTNGYLKTISNNRIEIYESYGKIKDNILIPDKFVIKRVNDNKTKIDTYTFNHQNEKTLIKKSRISQKEKIEFEDKSKFYAKNDFLTLLFNLKFLLNKDNNYEFYAIGVNKDDGKLDVKIKKDNEKTTLNVFTNKKELKDSKFFITLNRDFIPVELSLKDMDFFGDIKAILLQNY